MPAGVDAHAKIAASFAQAGAFFRGDRAISRCNIAHRLFSSLPSVQPHGVAVAVAVVVVTVIVVDPSPRPHRRSLTDSPGASNNVASQPFHPQLNHLPVTSTPTSPDERLWKAAGALGVAEGRAISAADKMSLA